MVCGFGKEEEVSLGIVLLFIYYYCYYFFLCSVGFVGDDGVEYRTSTGGREEWSLLVGGDIIEKVGGTVGNAGR